MSRKESLHAIATEPVVPDGTPAITACVKPRVKDRIFAAAWDLFYKHGIAISGWT